MEDKKYYRIGRIKRPHALHGQVVAQLFRPRSPTSRPGGKLLLTLLGGEEKLVTLVSVQFRSPTEALLKFEEVRGRDAATSIKGAMISIDVRNPPPALADSVDQYLGKRVVSHLGAELGTVEDIRDHGAHPLLVVGEEAHLIPWVEALVKVDPDTSVLRLADIDGLVPEGKK